MVGFLDAYQSNFIAHFSLFIFFFAKNMSSIQTVDDQSVSMPQKLFNNRAFQYLVSSKSMNTDTGQTAQTWGHYNFLKSRTWGDNNAKYIKIIRRVYLYIHTYVHTHPCIQTPNI